MANILVIDDEPGLLGLISTTLRQDGHCVTALNDPLAAIEGAMNGGPAIDLLLTDVSMKPISGF
jgi:CheY-like chemotaxis protein